MSQKPSGTQTAQSVLWALTGNIVQYLARRVAIMYMGRIVEIGATDDVYHRPRHPYTRALLSAVPVARGGPERTRTVLKGDPPSPLDPPSGCSFRTRCPHALPACAEAAPPLRAAIGAHAVACLRDDI
jgi:peptide/nickel transport system ATP-binding protein